MRITMESSKQTNTFTNQQIWEFIIWSREYKEGEDSPYTQEEIEQYKQIIIKRANEIYRSYWKELGWKY